MSNFIWEERYSTGIPSIDLQHQELFRTIGRLHEAFRQGRGNKELGPILDSLMHYVQSHFAEEEAYMQRIRFPELPVHRMEHVKIRMKVEELCERYSIGDPTVAMDVSVLLYEWLRDHILQLDFAYVAHAQVTGQN